MGDEMKIYHGRGWLRLHEPVLAALPPGVEIREIGQTFGRLRFHITHPFYATGALKDAISWTHDESYCVCEECGGDGVLRRSHSKIQTLCDGCDDTRCAHRR